MTYQEFKDFKENHKLLPFSKEEIKIIESIIKKNEYLKVRKEIVNKIIKRSEQSSKLYFYKERNETNELVGIHKFDDEWYVIDSPGKLKCILCDQWQELVDTLIIYLNKFNI